MRPRQDSIHSTLDSLDLFLFLFYVKLVSTLVPVHQLFPLLRPLMNKPSLTKLPKSAPTYRYFLSHYLVWILHSTYYKYLRLIVYLFVTDVCMYVWVDGYIVDWFAIFFTDMKLHGEKMWSYLSHSVLHPQPIHALPNIGAQWIEGMNGLYQKLDVIEVACYRLLCLKLEGLSRKTDKLNNCNSS